MCPRPTCGCQQAADGRKRREKREQKRAGKAAAATLEGDDEGDDFFVDDGDFARERVESCAQATDGISLAELAERPDRAFFGSDHCAVLLRLKGARAGGGASASRREDTP